VGNREYIKLLEQTIYRDFSSNLRMEELNLLDSNLKKGLMETRLDGNKEGITAAKT